MSTRQEHMVWCKKRALEYLPDDPTGALASFMSDINKHDETRNDRAITSLTTMLMLGGHLRTADQVRRHIEGFN